MMDKKPKIAPNGSTFKKLCEVAFSTAEALRYAIDMLEHVFKSLKVEDEASTQKFKDVLEAQAKQLELGDRRNADKIWSGLSPDTSIINIQESLAKEAEAILRDSAPDIRLDYAMDDESHILRGYSSGGKPLDKEKLDAMDKQFNLWLVQNGMMCKDGVIYECTDAGEMKKDKNKPVVVAPESFAQKLKDPQKGYATFLNNRNVVSQLDIQEKKYPSSEKTAAGPGTEGA